MRGNGHNSLNHDLFGIDSSFADYPKFEVGKKQRYEQKQKFMDGEVWVPNYSYPELQTLYDVKYDEDTGKQTVLSAKKLTLQYSVMELEALKEAGEIDANLAELYSAFYYLRLKRIFLVESARELFKTRDSHRQETLRRSFLEINKELYGEFNEYDFRGILRIEKARLNEFSGNDTKTNQIVDELKNFYNSSPVDFNEYEEEQILEAGLIKGMLPIIQENFSYVWDAVPSTDINVRYDAHQCKKIINNALELSGLSELGWSAVVNSKKKAPSTSSDSKKISLPSSTNRNAMELRALIIHEVGVHAQRAQNGEGAGINILRNGTADYADVEEGLGVFLECIVNNSVENAAFHRARDRYIAAGLALGSDGVGPKDARQSYELLWRIIAARKANGENITDGIINDSKNEAYDHIENAYRGTNFAIPGMIYSKLKVYREGLIKNINYFTSNINNLEDALSQAMIGKYNHTDEHEKELVIKISSAIEK